MKKRVRTIWQRTPKSMREVIEDLQIEVAEQDTTIKQLQTNNGNLTVQRDSAEYALKLIADVAKLDVVITPPGEGLTTYYAITSRNQIMPIFGVLPGDKILIARKKVL